MCARHNVYLKRHVPGLLALHTQDTREHLAPAPVEKIHSQPNKLRHAGEGHQRERLAPAPIEKIHSQLPNSNANANGEIRGCNEPRGISVRHGISL